MNNPVRMRWTSPKWTHAIEKRASHTANREEMNFTFTAWGKLHKCKGSKRLQQRVTVQEEDVRTSSAYHIGEEKDVLCSAYQTKMHREGTFCKFMWGSPSTHGVTRSGDKEMLWVVQGSLIAKTQLRRAVLTHQNSDNECEQGIERDSYKWNT